ncbi:hypothetical protein [Polluticoccus soli]|uniref:hypothetical protein n=1 Tax=Polluticoccus soli TaxID=3034150 RepID=UPI0023E17D1A|nr:hypothetical protein [Flavipsychrobacter sp. JY13-12]
MKPLSALCCLFLFLSSCTKDTITQEAGVRYFYNDLPVNLIVDIYHIPDAGTTATEYIQHIFIKKMSVPAHATVTIGDDGMKNGEVYDCDWYSADYKYSGWNQYGFAPRFTYQQRGEKTKTFAAGPSNNRLICLSGNAKQTVWRTVGAFDKDGNDIWNILPDSEKYHVVVIDWARKVTDSNYIIPDGAIRQAEYVLHDSSFVLLVPGTSTQPSLKLTTELNLKVPHPPVHTDSLYYSFRYNNGGLVKDKGYYYLVKKTELRY